MYIQIIKLFLYDVRRVSHKLVFRFDLHNGSKNNLNLKSIRLSEKFLSFYKKIIEAQCFLFYISLSNYART